MRYFIEFSYFGKNYHGWQSQPNAITVQEVLEKALSTLLRKPLEIVGAGRTDRGVHAKQMFAHFDVEEELSEDLIRKLNSFLPKDIAIYSLRKVKSDAHTRFDATQRTYEYRIATKKSPFTYEYAYLFTLPLRMDLMNKACDILFEYKDFQCFSKSNTDVKTYFCKIFKAKWDQKDDELLFTISADRFLRNMVRAVVGTLLEVGLERMNLEEFRQVIESKNRSKAGASVPAHGLYLIKVDYPDDIYED